MTKNVEEIVEELFLKLKGLPSGTEISTSELLGKDMLKKFSTKDLFDINKRLMEKCEMENIKLNFEKFSGTIVGLPFNIPFTKE